jgi:hypothetical protein
MPSMRAWHGKTFAQLAPAGLLLNFMGPLQRGHVKKINFCSRSDPDQNALLPFLPDDGVTPLADEKINQIKTVGVCHNRS